MVKESTAKRSLGFIIALIGTFSIGLYFYGVDSTNPQSTADHQSSGQKVTRLLTSNHTCTAETCILKNVCVDRQKQLFYFSSEPVSLPTLDVIPSAIKVWDDGFVNTIEPKVIPPQVLANAGFIKSTVVLSKTVGMGDFQTTLLRNVLPYKKMIKELGYDTMQFALLNDCLEQNWNAFGDADSSISYQTCKLMTEQIYPLIFHSSSINTTEMLLSREFLCFETAIYGIPIRYDMMNNKFSLKNDLLKEDVKKSIHQQLSISPNFTNASRIIIVASCRPRNEHGKGIKYCSTLKKKIDMIYNGTYKGLEVIVKLVDFALIPELTDRIKTVAEANIYFSDGYEDSIYSLFQKNGAIAISLPKCSNCKCFHDLKGARIAVGVTQIFLDSSAYTCPSDMCDDWTCGNQPVGFSLGFQVDLHNALELSYQHLWDLL